ncbi:hypothetical protein KIN20_006327 [Parelaphostrongylus tenuis]|uniref:Uncharacterized protein n=1 Tax=Parelaphostrongylus tenuis TaxID=148309 RepID=A0AAD5M1L5_PARTN|nr:hypothetical protein KIN20_006327 [Parelaphostrongylus tenuis]
MHVEAREESCSIPDPILQSETAPYGAPQLGYPYLKSARNSLNQCSTASKKKTKKRIELLEYWNLLSERNTVETDH